MSPGICRISGRGSFSVSRAGITAWMYQLPAIHDTAEGHEHRLGIGLIDAGRHGGTVARAAPPGGSALRGGCDHDRVALDDLAERREPLDYWCIEWSPGLPRSRRLAHRAHVAHPGRCRRRAVRRACAALAARRRHRRDLHRERTAAAAWSRSTRSPAAGGSPSSHPRFAPIAPRFYIRRPAAR